VQAEANRRTGDATIYRYYVGSVGWFPSIVFMVSIVIFIFGMSFPSKFSNTIVFSTIANHGSVAVWVKKWAEYNQEHPNQHLGYYLGIYAMFGALALIFLVTGCW
jgi:ATP-binding cassette subfamily C (CFTR/MRP) protein 1